jgi:hypothetical protein
LFQDGGDLMTSDIAKIRGGEMLSMKNYVMRKFPRETYNEILDEMDSGYRDLYNSVIAFNEFYSLRAYKQFIDAFLERASPEEFEDSAKYLAHQNLKGLFLFLARILSKKILIEKMSSMWKKVYTIGDVVLIKADDQSSGFELIEFKTDSIGFQKHLELYCKTMLELATKTPHRSESKIIDDNKYEFWYYPEK